MTDYTVLDWLEPVMCPYCDTEAEKAPEDACWSCPNCGESMCI